MRLIDADNINFHCNYDGDCTGDIDSCKECENYICDFRDIQEQPTAYDIGNVVEELEEMKMRYFLTIANTEDEKSDFAYENVGNALDKAIEIVKHGSVSDEVCEWKRDDMCDTVYKVCGGCFTSEYQKDFKYCPYCGKKIKVVE